MDAIQIPKQYLGPALRVVTCADRLGDWPALEQWARDAGDVTVARLLVAMDTELTTPPAQPTPLIWWCDALRGKILQLPRRTR